MNKMMMMMMMMMMVMNHDGSTAHSDDDEWVIFFCSHDSWLGNETRCLSDVDADSQLAIYHLLMIETFLCHNLLVGVM